MVGFMKKIGIITFHNAHNYGACLQAYAFQQYLKSKNNEVKIINYDSKIKTYYNLIIPAFRKNIIKYIFQLIYNLKYYKTRKKRYDSFQEFIYQYLELSDQHYRTEKQLKRYAPSYDYYICGSDQIWNIDLVGELSDAFTLNFGAEPIRKISYAASIGKDCISVKEKQLYKTKLSHLDEISVREPEAQKILTDLLGREVQLVVDPVFLLEKSQWQTFTQGCLSQTEKKKYILVYSVVKDKHLVEIVNYISEKTGYGVIAFEAIPFHHVIKYVNDASPVQFVRLIQDAEIVIANSFHALAFSLIFEKNFWIVPHENTNSRMENLLKLTNNQNRLIHDVSEMNQRDLFERVQTQMVGSKLKKEIEKSKQYLSKALEME